MKPHAEIKFRNLEKADDFLVTLQDEARSITRAEGRALNALLKRRELPGDWALDDFINHCTECAIYEMCHPNPKFKVVIEHLRRAVRATRLHWDECKQDTAFDGLEYATLTLARRFRALGQDKEALAMLDLLARFERTRKRLDLGSSDTSWGGFALPTKHQLGYRGGGKGG